MTSLPHILRNTQARILRVTFGSDRDCVQNPSVLGWRRWSVTAFAVTLLSCSGGGGGSNDGETPSPAPPAPPTAGLDQRPSNTSCLASASSGVGTIRLEAAFSGRTFNAPLALLQAPGDNGRWFVVEQAGVVRDFSESNSDPATTFVDISAQVESGGEKGLLGMAFHPQYPTNGRVYLSYTHRAGSQLLSRISAFDTVATGNGRRQMNAASEQVLLTVNQPFDNHNGGHIAFGPDGYLYIGFGDGGSGDDPQNNGQQRNTLLGKLLRIDVDGIPPYSIPSDNPFSGGAMCTQGVASSPSAQCPEIWAYGLRNPWRWSFDSSTGLLWLADVGQNQWEEVNRIERAGNYGWRCREGAHDHITANCPNSGLIDPVAEYPHTNGNISITGGYVYRDTQSTPLQGQYLFADFGSGRIWTTHSGTRTPRELLDSTANIASFGESNGGELYAVDMNGPLSRIVFEPATGGTGMPADLSATGCVNSANPSQPATSLIPYVVNAPFWSDGAEKERWIALPNDTRITVNANGDWTLPPGSVVMKHFRRDGRLIETRLLLHHTDDQWSGVTYEWNAAQTDAARVQGGARRTLPTGGEWLFPSESDCLVCHTVVAGFSLGLETAQLNRSHLYPQTQRTANQIDTLGGIAVLNPEQPAAATLPAMANPNDTTGSLEARARAWLHTNCSHCHRPGGPTSSAMDLRHQTALAATQTCNVVPNDMLGLSDMRLITPGDSNRSMIVNRAGRRDSRQMPPVGTLAIDQSGLELLAQWIESLTGC